MRWSSLTLACLLVGATARADPRPVDRVVARVDGAPILLSELRLAARPRLAQLAGQPAWQRARVLRLALDEAREAAIAGALLSARARQRGLVIADAEVAAALAHIAGDQKLGVDELLAVARAAGFPAPAYRAALRRQLLEQRLLLTEPYGRAGSPPSGAARSAWLERRRDELLSELRGRACVERFGRF